MNNKTKRNLKKVIVGGTLALTLTLIPTANAFARVDPPIVFSVENPTK